MQLTEAEYHQHVADSDGYCVECDDFTVFSSVEPDAENYECEDCGEGSVIGAEQAMLEGKLEIVE